MPSDQTLYEEHYSQYLTYRQIAEFHRLNADSVRSRVGRYARALVSHKPAAKVSVLGKEAPDYPRLTQMPILRGPFIAVSDVHAPLSEWNLVELIGRFAERYLPKGERVGAIVGDLFNFDALSQYDHIVAPVSIKDELDVTEYLLDYWLMVFDVLYLSMGNHDYRFHKFLRGELGADRLARMLSKHVYTGRLIVTNKTQMVAVQAGQLWRLTHQRNFSKIKGRVANDLSLKHQCNMLTAHEHHLAMQRDLFNRYTTINNGALVDYEKLGYVMLVDSTSGVMCNGFTYLPGNGSAHLLSPYPTFTDWERWGMEREALPAIVEAENKQRRLTLPDEEKPVEIALPRAA